LITLRPYQKCLVDYVDGGGLRAVSIWHRRAGKDWAALTVTYRQALQRVGTVFYMAPSTAHAKKIIWTAMAGGRSLLDTVIPPEAVASRNETEMRLVLKNGSTIWFTGSDNYDRLVGTSPVGLVYSEYALARPHGFDFLRPILQENRGWAVFISTPRSRNHLYRLYEVARKDPAWSCSLLTIHDTGVLPASILEEEARSGMPLALIRQEYECSFDSALVGSVYGDLLSALAERGGVEIFDVEGARDVFTSWDLGYSDSTAIWFWRVVDDRVEVIDHYEASGKPLSHYLDHIEQRSYTYRAHYLPHDARARSYQTGTSTIELARERLGRVTALPIMPVTQGIEAARWLLQTPMRLHVEKCAAGLEALRAYSYSFDEDRRTFSDKPEHGWASHSADGFRYLAMAARTALRQMRPAPEPSKPSKVGFARMTLDELFEDYAKQRARKVRI
jgi:hypothetical protein